MVAELTVGMRVRVKRLRKGASVAERELYGAIVGALEEIRPNAVLRKDHLVRADDGRGYWYEDVELEEMPR